MTFDANALCRYLQEKQHLAPEDFDDGTALFSSGLLDSFSMVDLIAFVEGATGVRVAATDVTLDNFDSVARILRFVDARRS